MGSPSSPNYYRNGFSQEKNRYQAAKLQKSEVGLPTYLIDTDARDLSLIHMRQSQRIAQNFLDDRESTADWLLSLNAAPASNFDIAGGDGSAEGLAGLRVGGFRAVLDADTDYKCTALGLFDDLAPFVHHEWTAIAVNSLTDANTQWLAGIFNGLGYHVVLDGIEYEIISNTATVLTLSGLSAPVAAALPNDFYYIKIEAPGVTAALNVYVDVYLRDIGPLDDAKLNHSPFGGTAPSAMRRDVLIQQVWIEQETAQQTTTDYVDSTGLQHHVMLLGEITVDSGTGNVSAISNETPGGWGANAEVGNSRSFNDPCVATADQPATLDDRLNRDIKVITVGDGVTSNGRFNGGAGLQAALTCRAQTILLLEGTYNISGVLVIPEGTRLMGENNNDLSSAPLISVDDTVVTAAVTVANDSIIDGIAFARSFTAGPSDPSQAFIAISDSAHLSNVQFFDTGHPADLIRVTPSAVSNSQVTVRGCSFAKSAGFHVKTELDTSSTLTTNILFEVCDFSGAGAVTADTMCLLTGGMVKFDHCYFSVNETAISCQLYSVAVGTPDAVPTYVNGLIVDSCTFTLSGAAVTAAGSAVLELETGHVWIRDSIFETKSLIVANLPDYGVHAVAPAGAYAGGFLQLLAFGNQMSGMQQGIRVTQGLVHSSYKVQSNKISGTSSVSLDVGIWASTPVAFTGGLDISGNTVYADGSTNICFFVEGNGQVRGNSAICTDQDLNSMGTIASEVKAGYMLQPGAGVLMCSSNLVHEAGGHGFILTNLAGNGGVTHVTNNVVEGGGRTQRGIYIPAADNCILSNNTIRDLRGSGIYHNGVGEAVASVNTITGASNDGATPAESAAIYGCNIISGNIIKDWYQFGVNPVAATSSVSSNVFDATGNSGDSIVVSVVSVDIVNNAFSGTRPDTAAHLNILAGANNISFVGNVMTMTDGYGVRGEGTAANFIIGDNTFNYSASGKRPAIQAWADNGWITGNTLRALGTAPSFPAIFISGATANTVDMVVTDNTIHHPGGLAGISADAYKLDISNNVIRAGRSSPGATQIVGDYSIHLIFAANVGTSFVSGNRVSHGMYIGNGNGGSRILNNIIEDLGLVVRHNDDVRIMGNDVTSLTQHATDDAANNGILVGEYGGVTANQKLLSFSNVWIVGNMIRVHSSVHPDLSLAGVDRIAAIHSQIPSRSYIKDNQINTNGCMGIYCGNTALGSGGTMYGIGTDTAVENNSIWMGGSGSHGIVLVLDQSNTGATFTNVYANSVRNAVVVGTDTLSIVLYDEAAVTHVVLGGATDGNLAESGGAATPRITDQNSNTTYTTPAITPGAGLSP